MKAGDWDNPLHMFYINIRLSKQFGERPLHCHSAEAVAIRTGMLEHRMKEIARSGFVFTLPSERLSRHKPFQEQFKPPAFNTYLYG